MSFFTQIFYKNSSWLSIKASYIIKLEDSNADVLVLYKTVNNNNNNSDFLDSPKEIKDKERKEIPLQGSQIIENRDKNETLPLIIVNNRKKHFLSFQKPEELKKWKLLIGKAITRASTVRKEQHSFSKIH